MPKHGHIRRGSLQFYPRTKARKILPRVSWNSLSDKRSDVGLLGFIGYKVGMASAYVKDNLGTSLTKGQRIVIPVTVIEFPTMRIFSVRFYKENKLIGEVLNENLDKELKKKIKIPKGSIRTTGTASKNAVGHKKKVEDFKDYDNIRIVVYSQVKKTGIKKKPDVAEIGLTGNLDEKLNFIKENLSKDISVKDFLNDSIKEGLVDVRGVTKGKGFQGSTKRFGLSLKFHKTEKGVRGPGSGGPWHPARVDFTQPMAGQMGRFTRTVINNKIIKVGSVAEEDGDINPKQGFKKYGKIRNDYVVISGSVQGPSKRQLLVTIASRPTRNQIKKNYEFLELR